MARERTRAQRDADRTDLAFYEAAALLDLLGRTALNPELQKAATQVREMRSLVREYMHPDDRAATGGE